MPRFATTLLYAFLAFLTTSTAAYSQEDNECSNGLICLTSFVWCGKGGCDWREDEYPIHGDLGRETGYGVIGMYESYNVTWKDADPNYPVNVTWRFGGNKRVSRWSTTTNDSFLTFRPWDIFQTFPNEFSNSSALEAQASSAHITNVIQISQPEKFADEIDPPRFADLSRSSQSSQFSVADQWALRAVVANGELARREEYNKWAKGVGIGVGVGVPILLGCALLAGWFVGKKRGRATATRKL